MKKIISSIFAVLAVLTLNAQQSLNVHQGNVTYCFTANVDQMIFADGKTLTVQGATFNLSDITGMEVVAEEFDDKTVLVEYNESSANVTIAGNIAQYVNAKIDGANVTIDQSEDVSEATCGEITYILKGSSANGSFVQDGTFKSTIELQGLTLTNPTGAAIEIQNGKRIAVSAKNNTVNTLVDGSKGDQKAALYCKGHLELKGKGTLNVTGNTAHAISAKEYIEIKNLTLNILGAAKDGINCTQYFHMESGTLVISNTGDDGIQASFKDDTDREAEDTGTITIKGGELTITNITATAAKGLKADGDFVMTDGTVTIKTSAPGDWDSSKSKTKASACISADGKVNVSGGSLNLTATSGGAKGITCDGDFIFSDGTLKIVTSGGVLAYSGGTLNQNYTGNTDNLKSDYKSSPKGVKADGAVTVSGGNIDIVTSGNGGEGIESKSTLTISDGYVKVRAKDDAINSSSHMYIKGGTVDVISTGNDGLDSNGDIYIQGGLVMAFGASAPECGLDANSEEGYTVYFTGGYILAAGGGNSVPTKSGSTQPFVSVSATVNASTEVSIGTSSSTIYTFTTPDDLTSVNLGGSSGNRPGGPGGMGQGGSSLLISVPGLTTGTSYTIKSGNTSTTGTAKLTGSNQGGRP